VSPREVDQLACSRHHCSNLGGARDGDPSTATKLQQPLVSEYAKSSKDGIGVDVQYRGQVSGRREALAASRFAVGDGATKFRRDLIMQRDEILRGST
jgi:hypothetical protein